MQRQIYATIRPLFSFYKIHLNFWKTLWTKIKTTLRKHLGKPNSSRHLLKQILRLNNSSWFCTIPRQLRLIRRIRTTRDILIIDRTEWFNLHLSKPWQLGKHLHLQNTFQERLTYLTWLVWTFLHIRPGHSKWLTMSTNVMTVHPYYSNL
jgi:hypothetical protein